MHSENSRKPLKTIKSDTRKVTHFFEVALAFGTEL